MTALGAKNGPSRAWSPATVLPLAAGFVAVAAHAGRPLTVDDAGTNAQGQGHVEVWASRAAGSTTLNVSPAYAIRDGLELAVLLAHEDDHHVTGRAAQVKVLLTPSRDRGCNAGAALGASQASGALSPRSDVAFVNGLASCNGTPLGNLHLNLGATRTSGQATRATWGLAAERSFDAVTAHVEWFGTERTKPIWQLGVRGDLVEHVQLDGTIGHGDGGWVYSLGLKLRF